MYDLRGKVALVTGASRGIGRAVAEGLAAAGCHVGLVARTAADLQKTAARCERHGVRALVLPTDVTDRRALSQAVDACARELGGLNVLVNNAGISGHGPAGEADLDRWDAALDVNLRAAMHATRLALPH